MPIYSVVKHRMNVGGWMVFNLRRGEPVAVSLTRGQAMTLATLLNVAARFRG